MQRDPGVESGFMGGGEEAANFLIRIAIRRRIELLCDTLLL